MHKKIISLNAQISNLSNSKVLCAHTKNKIKIKQWDRRGIVQPLDWGRRAIVQPLVFGVAAALCGLSNFRILLKLECFDFIFYYYGRNKNFGQPYHV